MQGSAQQQLISSVVTVLIVGLVLFFRLRGLNRERPFRVQLVWIMPAILLVMTGLMMAAFPPRGTGWLVLAAAFVVGAIPGWWRGRLIPIWRDSASGELRTKSSLAAIIFLLILFAVRAGARYLLETEKVAWHIDPRMIDVGFVVLALGLLGVSRVEMGLRALKIARSPVALDHAARADA